MHNEKEISQSTNKTKAAWNVIRSLINKRVNSNEELIFNYKRKLINDPQTLAETFTNYFTKVLEESVSKVIKHDCNQVNNEISLENLVHGPYKPVNLMPVTGKEINEIKKEYEIEELLWL
jgi:phosphoenolpyruvate-protein kinase (PTS system EI component)